MRWQWLSLVLACPMSVAVAAETPASTEDAHEAAPLALIPVDPDPTEATAESADDAVPVALEPMTTVGTRTPRQPLDLPASVSIVGADDIEERQLSTLGEALSGLAGVNISGGPRENGESINIRGLSGTRVLLSVDGARQNFDGAHRSRLYVDPELLKSVDVLRGPASALWGSDALGGVVALETKDAADLLRDGERFGMRLKAGVEGANDERLGGATAFGQAGAFDWLMHVSDRTTDDATLGDGSTLPHSALDSNSGLYKASWFPEGAHSFTASFQRFFQSGETPSNPNQEVDADNPLLARDNDQHYLTARYRYAGGEWLEAGQVTAYRTALAIVEDRVDEYRHDTLDFVTDGLSAHASLRLDTLDQRLTFGGDAYRDTSEATRNGAPRSQFPDATRDVVGVFVQDEIGLGNGWSLIPGLRYDRVQAVSNTDTARATREDALSGKLAGAYEVTDWLAVHAGYGQAFRAPSLLETYAAGTHFLGNTFRPNPDLRPERAANLEGGVRLDFADLLGARDRLRLRATGYHNDIDDYIETVVIVETEGPFPPAEQCTSPTPAQGCINRNEDGSADPTVPPIFIGGYTTSENLRNARIRGVEIEADYQLGGVTFVANYSASRGEDTSTGAPLLSIAADSVNGLMTFDWRGFRLGGRVVHALAQDRVPTDSEGNLVVPYTDGYTVLDVFVTWEPRGSALRGARIALGVDNVTDRFYRNHLAPLPDAGISPRAAIRYEF